MTISNSDTVISVEGLSKSYLIGHERQTRGYQTFRESLLRGLKGFGRAAIDTLRGRQILDGEDIEEFWALKDVSFEVKRGEVLGIIGRNGAGKSTLLKILSRITEPTEGRVRIKGRVASLLEVGTGFHPELTGRENIYLNGAILGMTRAEIKRKFDEIVAFAEVEKFLDTPVKRYSSGMYVRLAFAVAAHLEPEILVVDEVLAVGDAEFQKKCLGKMQDVAGQGRTVLFVSHNMSAIEQMCSRCILLRSGAITVDGLPAEVLSQYLTDVKLAVNGGIDLKNHPLRLKCYKSIISEITIKNSRYEPTTRLPTEDNAVFDIVIEPSQQIREPRIAISIEDSYGRRLMTMTSYFSHMPLSRISRKTIIRCESGPLRLAPGKYLLSVSVGTKQDGLLDSIDGATWFEVEWNSGNNNGEVYSPDYGPLLREAVWRSI